MNNEKMFELAVILAAPQIASRPALAFQDKVDFVEQCYKVVQAAAKKL